MNPALLAQLATLLLEHGDLIAEVMQALAAGAPKDAVRAAVKAAMEEASDRALREELRGGQ